APVKVSVGALDLPYVETFETGVEGVNMPCAAVAGTWSSSIQYWYLRSGAYSTSYPGVTNHTPGGNKYIFSGYYNGPYYGSGENYFWFTPALKMTAGKGYSVGFWFNGAGYSTGTNGLKVGIYAGTTQSATGMTIRAGGIDSVVDASAATYRQMVRGFVAPTTGNYYVGIKTVHTGYNYPGIPIDDINVTQLTDCNSKPVAGTPDATPSLICSSGTTVLRLTGTSVASGITYKWYESTSATGPWTASSTGTGFAAGDYTTATLTSTKYYRCVVGCSITGLYDTSAVVAVSVGGVTPPYREDFEKVTPGSNAVCASYSSTWSTATSTTYWTTKGFSYTAYGVVHGNHTPGGSNYLWGGYYFGYSPAAGAMWFTPAIKLTKDSTYEFSFWYQGPGYYYYNSGVELGMWYGTAQTEAAMTTSIRSLWADKRSTYRQLVGRFKSIGTGNYYMGIRVRHLYSTYSYYGTSIDDIALDQLTPCTGVPTAGNTWAKPGMLCSSGTTVLDMDLTGVTKASGLTYRWEYTTSDPTTGPFIATGSSAVLTAPTFTSPTLTQTTWFRCIVKCSNTGDSTISAVNKVDVTTVTPPYFQDFETVDQGSNAPCASNTYTFSSSSFIYWNVLRVPISTSYPAIDNHTPNGTAFLMAGYYLGTYYSGAAQWWFTPAIKMTGGQLYYMSFWYNGSAYSGGKTDIAAAYGTSNTAAGMTTTIGTPLTGVNTSMWQKYDGRFTPATSGNYYVGIKVSHTTYAYPGMAIDDIGVQMVPPCSSTVVAGTIKSNPAHICSMGGSAVLDLDGSTLATGLTYEWFSSNSPLGPWVTTGGTTLPYTTDPLPSTTYFKCVVKCTASGKADTTAAFKMGVGGKDLPYIEDFETTPAGTKPLCSDATTWGTYYYDGWNVYAGTYTGSYTNHTPGGKMHLIGGYYLGYTTYSPTYTTVTDDNYWWTPGLNLRSGYKYKLNFWYVGASGGYVNQMGVYYGKSQSVGAMTGTIFPLRSVTNTAYSLADTAFTVPSSGVYYLGFKKTTNRTYNYYGVAFDDINLNYAPCDGKPYAGTISGSIPSGTGKCLGTYAKMTDIGASVSLVPGIRYQWYRRNLSLPTATWSGVVGATDTILASDTLIGYEYKLAVICRNTNDTVYSPAYQLPQLTPHPPVTISPSTSPITFCVGDTVKFNATNYTGAVYDWMRDSVVVPGWKFSDMGAVDPGTYMVKVTSALSPCPAYSNKVKLVANDPGYTVTITKPADSILCAGS
ncbi:hypothetical protein, partial [Rurimicrobium arvi]|uniref:hypothetical protein n=1 Tax=Rurimicrobium arvi TaxID=2049916 RepID=UPI0031D518D9